MPDAIRSAADDLADAALRELRTREVITSADIDEAIRRVSKWLKPQPGVVNAILAARRVHKRLLADEGYDPIYTKRREWW